VRAGSSNQRDGVHARLIGRLLTETPTTLGDARFALATGRARARVLAGIPRCGASPASPERRRLAPDEWWIVRRLRGYDAPMPTLDIPEREVPIVLHARRSASERFRDGTDPWFRFLLRVGLRLRYRRSVHSARAHDTFPLVLGADASARASEILGRRS
jgi:hypothetical protein